MKAFVTVVGAGVLALLLALPGWAVDEVGETRGALEEALEADELPRALPEEALPFVEGLNPAGGTGGLDQGVDNAVRAVGGQLGGLLREALGGVMLVLAVVLLCAAAAPMLPPGRSPDVVTLAGALAITALVTGQVTGLMGAGRQAIDAMDGFSKALLPTLAAATAAAGAPLAATARHMATALFSDIVLTLIARVCAPLVYAYVAMAAAGAALGQDMLTQIARFLKWALGGLLTLSLTLFTAYLTLSGALAGSADALAVKGAKLALSGGVPVVGGIVSDAAETLLVGAGLLKNAVGLFGLFAVLGICLAPILRVAAQYLLYKLLAALAAPLANEGLGQLLTAVSGAFGLILGMTGAASLLLFISLISMIAGGQAL